MKKKISHRCLSFRIGFSLLAGRLHIGLDDILPLTGGGDTRPDIWDKEQDTFNSTFHRTRDSVIADFCYSVPIIRMGKINRWRG